MLISALNTDELRVQIDQFAQYPLATQRQNKAELEEIAECIIHKLSDMRCCEPRPIQSIELNPDNEELLELQSRVTQLFSNLF